MKRLVFLFLAFTMCFFLYAQEGEWKIYTIKNEKYEVPAITLSAGDYTISLKPGIPLNTECGEFTVRLQEDRSAIAISAPEIKALAGDVNDDRIINIVDTLLVAQHYIGIKLEYFNEANADVNGDKKITIVDALLIAQYYVGIIEILPAA
ncbi:MAG: dockerin type I repeat-containing protein [Spirochaetales bacterium]|nr:dockerin type I repeat-containing protein [Spirochaetales bacterium]